MDYKKLKHILLIIIVGAIFLSSCTSKGTNLSEKTIILDENVQKTNMIEDRSMNISNKAEIILYPPLDLYNFLGIYNWHAIFKKNKKLYSIDMFDRSTSYLKDTLDISEQSPNILGEFDVIRLSENNNKALYLEGKDLYIYNLYDNSSQLMVEGIEPHLDCKMDLLSMKLKLITGEIETHASFADKEGKYLFYFNSNDSQLNLVNTETKENISLNMKQLFNFKNLSILGVKIYENYVYLGTDNSKDDPSIHRISFDGKKETILTLSNQDTIILQFDIINGGKTIIFNGYCDNEPGIFLYDIEKDYLVKAVPGGPYEDGLWIPFYSISPDRTKLVFDRVVQEKDGDHTNLYIAEIIENRISKSLCIMEKAKLSDIVSLLTHWSEDSNTFYIKVAPTEKYNNNYIEKIILFD